MGIEIKLRERIRDDMFLFCYTFLGRKGRLNDKRCNY